MNAGGGGALEVSAEGRGVQSVRAARELERENVALERKLEARTATATTATATTATDTTATDTTAATAATATAAAAATAAVTVTTSTTRPAGEPPCPAACVGGGPR
jgi:hypothetical protein